MSERYPSDDQLRFEAFVQHYETMHAKQSTDPIFSKEAKELLGRDKVNPRFVDGYYEQGQAERQQHRPAQQYREEQPKRIEHRKTEETKSKNSVLWKLRLKLVSNFLLVWFLGVYPLIMFDIPWFVYSVLSLLMVFIGTKIPFLIEVLWIAGLFAVIPGTQDVFAIIYYVVFAILVVRFVIKMIRSR